jgi:putative sigma-54 modulation protein
VNIEYVGRNYEIDDRVRTFTHDRLRKVLKFLEEPIDIHVGLESNKHRYIADLRLSHRHGSFQAQEETDQLLDAIALVVEKTEKQVRRGRKKLMDRRRRAQRAGRNGDWPMEVVDRASLGAGAGPPRIIKSTLLQIKPMGIDEAALELDGSKNDFIVFRDADTARVSVLYKRKDNNYGLIAPDL